MEREGEEKVQVWRVKDLLIDRDKVGTGGQREFYQSHCLPTSPAHKLKYQNH